MKFKKKYIKKNYKKMERKKIMTWMLTWLNMSAAALNATFQLLVIYRFASATFISYSILPSRKAILSIIPYHFITQPTSHLQLPMGML